MKDKILKIFRYLKSNGLEKEAGEVKKIISSKKAKQESIKSSEECPDATQNIKLNNKNRSKAIKSSEIKYGPIKKEDSEKYWKSIAQDWKVSESEAKKKLCGNCVAFDISPRMKECMTDAFSENAAKLGYCHMHNFACHKSRTCKTWAKGGPIKSDKVSYEK